MPKTNRYSGVGMQPCRVFLMEQVDSYVVLMGMWLRMTKVTTIGQVSILDRDRCEWILIVAMHRQAVLP